MSPTTKCNLDAVYATIATALGALTTAVIAGYAGAVLQTVGWGDVVPTVTLPKILPEHLAIKDPVYEGFDPGDEPDHDTDSLAVKQTSEEQALESLRKSFNIEKIAEQGR